MSAHRSMRGFTLMEVILSVTVATGVVMAVFSAYQLIDQIRLRQEHAGVVVWEGDLLMHRLRSLSADGFTVPAPQGVSETVTLADGSVIHEDNGRLVLTDGATDEFLSSKLVTVGSLSFTDMGTADAPGLLRVVFELSSVATDSRTEFELMYDTVIYAE